jgi:hypothetical protein
MILSPAIPCDPAEVVVDDTNDGGIAPDAPSAVEDAGVWMGRGVLVLRVKIGASGTGRVAEVDETGPEAGTDCERAVPGTTY